MYSPLIESLKRLYENNQIETIKITELFQSNKITEEEKNYILRKE